MTSPDYAHRNVLAWEWSNPYRKERISEVLGNGKFLYLLDFTRLQNDYYSIPARTVTKLLPMVKAKGKKSEKALELLGTWDHQMNPESIAAAIYAEWEKHIIDAVYRQVVLEKERKEMKSIPTKLVLDYLITPPAFFGKTPIAKRDEILNISLDQALEELTKRLGGDMDKWAFGQTKNKHITIKHAFSEWVDDKTREKIDLGPIPRGGSSETINNTGNTLNQTHGAAFRMVVDTENWDKTLGVNSPGQSGDPASAHYKDLFEKWAAGQYFPVYFTKEKIKTVAEKTYVLKP
jgi:penicillin amidase